MAANPLGALAYGSPDDVESLAARVWRLIANDHGPADDPAMTARMNEEAELLYFLLLDSRGANQQRMFELCSLIGELVWNYPICVRLERHSSGKSKSVRLTVERRVVPELFGSGSVALETDGALSESGDTSGGKITNAASLVTLGLRLLDAIRRFAGVPASVITHDLTNASRAASYHLQIAGPPGYYAARLRLLDVLGRRIEPAAIDAVESDSAILRGQRHAHLYLRGASGARDAKLEAGYYERTPGSMAVATAAALATLVVTGIIAAAQVSAALAACDSLVGSAADQCLRLSPANTGASEGLLQILLTFPIALVAMSARRNDAVWGGVLVARVTNAAVVFLTLCALALSVFAGALTPAGLSVAWIVVTGLMTVVLGSAGTSWILRSLIHIRYVRNAGPKRAISPAGVE
ncbi:hypothetical protein [Microbacterium marmarense]|uniref:Uncharacterized protein n=1 Tax=Microbacterium marmarense TaxID=3122051 RepID=A0ABU8LSC4_9MICO